MGPYTRIEGVEKLTLGIYLSDRITSPEAYLAWQLMQIQVNGSVVQRWRANVTLEAFIQHGRWMTTCQCRVGMLTSPAIPIACCSWCGAVYHDVTFPADREQIEQALLDRPHRESQSWKPPETLADLLLENEVHAMEIDAFQRLNAGAF